MSDFAPVSSEASPVYHTDLPPAADAALVHFSGVPASERKMLADVLEDVEAQRDAPGPALALAGAPWVVTRHTLGEERVLYIADRQGDDAVVTARSFDMLVERLRAQAKAAALLQFAYTSVAVAPFSQLQLNELLETSRRNNAARGITGLLLHRDGVFVQFIEGPEQAVRGLYETLLADPRHTDLHPLLETPAAARTFGDWRMDFEDLAGVCPDAQTAALPGESGTVALLRHALRTLAGPLSLDPSGTGVLS